MSELYENPSAVVFTTPLPELEKWGISKDAAILDLGCGYGRILKHLYEQGYHNLAGIDFSEKLIGRAKEILPQARYIVGDIRTELISEKFDVILMCGVLEYISEDEQRKSMVDAVSECLKEGGKLYLEAFVRDENDIFYSTRAVNGKPYGTVQLSNGIILFHGSIDEIDTLFERRLRKVCGKETNFVTWTNCEAKGYIVVYEKDNKVEQENKKIIIGILLENHRWYEKIKSNFTKYNIEEYRISDMDHPFLKISASEKVEYMITIGYGSSIAASCVEEMRYLGATMAVRIGSTGSLSPLATIGDVVVATAAVRDEGVSKFYLDEGVPAMAHPIYNDALSKYLTKLGLSIKKGIVYTTDGRWREDREKMKRLASCGIISVEMESAAIFAVGMGNSFPVLSLSVVSDNPHSEESEFVGVITDDAWNNIVVPKFEEVFNGIIEWGKEYFEVNIL